MARARILLLITDLELGGTPTVVRELALRLRATGSVEIEVACLSTWGPVAWQLRDAGVTVTTLNAKGAHDLSILPPFVRLVRGGRFDTVFSFLIHANALAAAASLWIRDVRWIQSIQTTQPRPRWHWQVQRAVHRGAETVVVPSMSVARCAREWSHIPDDKIVVIPNAIDLSDYADARSTVPVADPRPYPIAFLGRLDPIKDIPTLIDAVAIVEAKVAIHLHIFGQGAEQARIEREIAARNLSGRITMHGAIDRPQTALASAGLLVLPSLAEGFGLVLIEAMAAGVPIVATNVPGIRDVVRDGETGLLVRPSDATALAGAIARIVQDRTLRETMIANAASDVRERFTWERVLKQYQKLLSS